MSDEKKMDSCDQNYGTSIGVEWETSICVFDPTTKLKKLDKKPLSCVENLKCKEEYKDGWTVSLEDDKGIPECLSILEGQIGVSCSMDDKKINKEKLKEQIESFSKFWNETIKDLNININGKDYPILLRDDKINCKKIKKDNMPFSNIFPIEKTSGKPQITFGIKLEYIPLLFIFIAHNFNNSIYQKEIFIRFSFFKKSMIETYKFMDEKKLDTLDNELLGFLYLVFYIDSVIEYEILQGTIKYSYLKSKFVLKIRTNLYELYEKKYKSIELPEDILEILKEFNDNSRTEIFEWDYPYKGNFNIFIECRDVENFILLCDPLFYTKNILKITGKELLNTPKLLKSDKFYSFFYKNSKDILKVKELEKFRNVSIEYLYSYCECVINILDRILDQGRGIPRIVYTHEPKNSPKNSPHIDTPQWSFGK